MQDFPRCDIHYDWKDQVQVHDCGFRWRSTWEALVLWLVRDDMAGWIIAGLCSRCGSDSIFKDSVLSILIWSSGARRASTVHTFSSLW